MPGSVSRVKKDFHLLSHLYTNNFLSEEYGIDNKIKKKKFFTFQKLLFLKG